MICSEGTHQLHGGACHPVHVHATERNSHSAAELEWHPSAQPACCFQDVEELWQPPVVGIIARAGAVDLKDLIPSYIPGRACACMGTAIGTSGIADLRNQGPRRWHELHRLFTHGPAGHY